MERALFLHPKVSWRRLGVGRRGKKENLGNGYLQSGLQELIFHSKLKKKSEQHFKAKKELYATKSKTLANPNKGMAFR